MVPQGATGFHAELGQRTGGAAPAGIGRQCLGIAINKNAKKIDAQTSSATSAQTQLYFDCMRRHSQKRRAWRHPDQMDPSEAPRPLHEEGRARPLNGRS